MICYIWNFVAFIGIVSTSTDYSSLRLVQFFAENDILIGIGSYLRVNLLLIQLFGSVWIVLFSGRTLVNPYEFRVT